MSLRILFTVVDFADLCYHPAGSAAARLAGKSDIRPAAGEYRSDSRCSDTVAADTAADIADSAYRSDMGYIRSAGNSLPAEADRPEHDCGSQTGK